MKLIHLQLLLAAAACGAAASIEPSAAGDLCISERVSPPPAEVDMGGPETVGPIEIYFIRHAQSIWNAAKPKIGLWWNIPGLTLFNDAELSSTGYGQAHRLSEAIEDAAVEVAGGPLSVENAALKLLSGVDPAFHTTTYIATSNLRRALQTELIALGSRATHVVGRELIHIMSSAQELSGGADARTEASGRGDVPIVHDSLSARFYRDGNLNYGEENGVCGTTVAERLVRFCREVRTIAQSGFRQMILTGHSTWLRELFQRYLDPRQTLTRVEKNLRRIKLGNAGVVKFTFDFRGTDCRISSGSSYLVFGGFVHHHHAPAT